MFETLITNARIADGRDTPLFPGELEIVGHRIHMVVKLDRRTSRPGST